MADTRTAERITLNLTARSSAALAFLAEHEGLNRTDVVNRALQLYEFWVQETAKGTRWMTVGPDDDATEIKIL